MIRASAIDNRSVADTAVAAWTEVLAPFEYSELLEAMIMHRRTSTEYLTPSHLAVIVTNRRKSENLTPQLEPGCPTHLGYPLPAGTEYCAFGIRNDRDCLTADQPYEQLTQAEAIAAGYITAPVLELGKTS
ncbi:hypothetical protein C5E11_04015 [Clavibacter michiganensis]|nr:hypothetical protein C5E11_04015 [Clavibacter michiganensis]